jgi:ABC-type glutathione transport system ATPase component
MSLLNVSNLSVEFLGRHRQMAVRALDFDLLPERTLGIVGESGSGKSTVALALMGLLPKQGRVRSGNAVWSRDPEPIDLLAPETQGAANPRGRDIALVSQHPGSALNPYLNIETQMTEHFIWHQKCSRREAREKALHMLKRVHIDRPHKALRSYPHQFSGGQQQRIAIAMALMTGPLLLIADEPTTALDTTVQAQILELLAELRRQERMSMLFISHDLRVISKIADEVLVMRKGQAVEQATPLEILRTPSADYTRQLIDSLPRGHASAGPISTKPLLQAKNICLSFSGSGPRAKSIPTLRAVSMEICSGEIVGIVGESGAGKSTLARALLRLLPIESGRVTFQSQSIHALNTKQMLATRARMQMVFQNPYASLNPRQTVGQTLREVLSLHAIVPKAQIPERISGLLEEVELPSDVAERYPHQFSGGQRQRLSIARALATEPALLIADEPLSALDITTQAQVIRLIKRLTTDRQLAVLFISHDLSTVQALCTRIIVMRDGSIVESGTTQSIFKDPQHAFTQALLDAVPQLPSQSTAS